MKFSGETVMAYADGELDAQTCRDLEAALPLDPALAHGVVRERVLQSSLRASFAPVLHDAVPQRLIDTARRTRNPASAAATRPHEPAAWRALFTWQLPGLIALVALGAAVYLGRMLGTQPTTTLTTIDGRMLATGSLASALAKQAGGSEPLQSDVIIGLSYLAKAGQFCRTFTVKRSESLAGLACREADGWHIQALAQTGPKSALAQYRMAGVLVPTLILIAVENTIDGSPLDPQAESGARARDWRR